MEKGKVVIPKSLTETMLSTQEETLIRPRKKKKLFIGIPKESSFQENRIALIPSAICFRRSQLAPLRLSFTVLLKISTSI